MYIAVTAEGLYFRTRHLLSTQNNKCPSMLKYGKMYINNVIIITIVNAS